MREKNLNTLHVEGRVYQHELAVKVTGPQSKNPGTEYISGNLDIATDEEGLNIITVHFTYMTSTYGSGKANTSYAELKKIIEGGKTWVADGKDEATKVKVDGSIALNDFYNREDVLVSTKVNEGSFVNIIKDLCPENERNTFSTDMVITGVTHVDADPEKHIDADFTRVNGAIFNFRNELLPLEFTVRNPQGMAYFEDLEITGSEPVFTKVWGKINSLTSKQTITEEAAFGEAAVRTFERKTKAWDITGTSKTAYDFGDEKVLTMADLTKAMQDRNTHLAGIKQRAEEWKAQQNQSTPAASDNAFNMAKGTLGF